MNKLTKLIFLWLLLVFSAVISNSTKYIEKNNVKAVCVKEINSENYNHGYLFKLNDGNYVNYYTNKIYTEGVEVELSLNHISTVRFIIITILLFFIFSSILYYIYGEDD